MAQYEIDRSCFLMVVCGDHISFGNSVGSSFKRFWIDCVGARVPLLEANTKQLFQNQTKHFINK